MATAIGFIMIVVAFGVFMPNVFHELSLLLQTLFGRATAFLNALPVPQPAMMSYQTR
jgi:hypothetical protein